jgi:hypothetical protein
MQNVLIALAAVTLIGLVGVLLASFYFLDRLIRYEYSFHRDAWEQDRRPNGFLFRAPERTLFGSAFAFQRCAFAWLFYTPLWIRTDSNARILLSRLRWCTLIWNLGIIAILVTFLISTRNI